MSVGQWKAFVNNVLKGDAFTRLRIHCANNRTTCHLHYELFIRVHRETSAKFGYGHIQSQNEKVYFKKNCYPNIWCPFCKREHETFHHLFACNSGVFCPTSIQSTHLTSFSSEMSLSKLNKLENSSVDTPHIRRKYCELLSLSCH